MLPEGLFAILDPNYSEKSTALIIEELTDAEALPFIVRHKSLSLEEYTRFVHEIDELRDAIDFDYLIHDHATLALRSQALGVHLTANSMPVAQARALLGHKKLIGYSAHSLEEAIQAKLAGADYIFLGAIFKTPKPDSNHPILGIDVLSETCRKIEIPVYAIGGINESNLLPIKDAGAAGFSSLRALYNNDEIEHNASKLSFMWEEV